MLVFGQVWFDEYGEFIWCVLFDDVKLIEIDIGEDIELILLYELALEFS